MKCPVDNTELESMGIPGSPGCFRPCKTCGREWYYTRPEEKRKMEEICKKCDMFARYCTCEEKGNQKPNHDCQYKEVLLNAHELFAAGCDSMRKTIERIKSGDVIRNSTAALWKSYVEKKMQVEDLIDLLKEITNSDMAQREEDEGRVSPLLEQVRKAINDYMGEDSSVTDTTSELEEIICEMVKGDGFRILESSDCRAFGEEKGLTIQMYRPDWQFGVMSKLVEKLRQLHNIKGEHHG